LSCAGDSLNFEDRREGERESPIRRLYIINTCVQSPFWGGTCEGKAKGKGVGDLKRKGGGGGGGSKNQKMTARKNKKNREKCNVLFFFQMVHLSRTVLLVLPPPFPPYYIHESRESSSRVGWNG
jgi:hypothetical protein